MFKPLLQAGNKHLDGYTNFPTGYQLSLHSSLIFTLNIKLLKEAHIPCPKMTKTSKSLKNLKPLASAPRRMMRRRNKMKLCPPPSLTLISATTIVMGIQTMARKLSRKAPLVITKNRQILGITTNFSVISGRSMEPGLVEKNECSWSAILLYGVLKAVI